jgi:hypothetical protein
MAVAVSAATRSTAIAGPFATAASATRPPELKSLRFSRSPSRAASRKAREDPGSECEG